MFYFSIEQFADAQKAEVDAMYRCAIESLNSFEKLAALNMQTMKTALDLNAARWRSALSGKGPQAFFEVAPGAQPFIGKVAAHNRQVFDILLSAHVALTGQADAQYERARKVQRGIVDAAKSGPGRAEAAIAALDSVINQHAVRQPLQNRTSGGKRPNPI